MSGIGITGFRAISPRNMLLNEGAAFMCVNLSKLRSLLGFSSSDWANAINAANTWTSAAGNLATPSLFGATRKGGKINFNAPVKQIPDIDGIRGPVMELDIRDYAECNIMVTVLEMNDEDKLTMGLAASDVDEWSSYKEVTPRMSIEPGDYIPNIAFAVTVNDSGILQPFIAILENALVVNAFEIQTERSNAVGVAYEFQGRAPITAPLDLPLHYFLPQAAGSGS